MYKDKYTYKGSNTHVHTHTHTHTPPPTHTHTHTHEHFTAPNLHKQVLDVLPAYHESVDVVCALQTRNRGKYTAKHQTNASCVISNRLNRRFDSKVHCMLTIHTMTEDTQEGSLETNHHNFGVSPITYMQNMQVTPPAENLGLLHVLRFNTGYLNGFHC